MIDPRSQFGPAAEKYLTSAVHANPSALERIVEVAHPNGGTVLDVATGAGHVAFTLARYVDRVIASDITPQMLNVVQRTAKERGLANLDCCFVRAEAMPFKTASLDGIVCRLGAHHFEQPQAFLSESHRALKAGGYFMLIDTIGIEGDDAADEQLHRLEIMRDPSHKRNYRVSEWVQMMDRAGFECVYEERATKLIEAEDWMERMKVPAPDRVTLVNSVLNSAGAFRAYLEPKGDRDSLQFFLWEALIRARPKAA